MEFDVAVVGAGTAGCVSAGFLARRGYDVCLLDQKPVSEIGIKVCGDAVGRHEFDDSGVPRPTTEVDRDIEGMQILGRDGRLLFEVRGRGYTLDRPAFGQRLLREAVDAGVELYDNTLSFAPIIEESSVKGIKGKVRSNGEIIELLAKVTIDATGISSAIRNRLPEDWPASEKIKKDDVGVTYREYREVEDPPDEVLLYFNWDVAPGGYLWIIPKKGNVINIGLGFLSRIETSAADLERRFNDFFGNFSLLQDSRVIGRDAYPVPLRAPVHCVTAPGFLAAGDAGYHVNPFDAGGIGPALQGGRLAADVIDEALRANDVGFDRLWKFNYLAMDSFGAKHAANDVMKEFMYTFSSDEVETFLKALGVRRTYHSGNLFLEHNLSDQFKMLLRLIGRPRLIKTLSSMRARMKEMKDHYQSYPKNPTDFSDWVTNLNSLRSTFVND